MSLRLRRLCAVAVALLANLSMAADPDTDQWVRDLVSPNIKQRTEAAQALVARGGSISSAVKPLLSHADPQVRVLALEILGRVKASAHLTEVSAHVTDVDAHVRSSALRALQRIGDQGAVPVARRALSDSNAKVRSQALVVLASLGDRQQIPRIVQLLRTRQATDEERRATIVAAGLLRARETVSALSDIAVDDSEPPQTRGAAAAILGDIADPVATAAALSCAHDANTTVRFNGIVALQSLGGSEAETVLAEVLQNEEEEGFIRVRAAWSLASRGSDFAIRALMQAVQTGREAVALQVVKALHENRLPGASQALRQLRDRSTDTFVQSELRRLGGVR